MSFDPVAPHYRWMERLFAGDKMQRARTALLMVMPPPQNALIYGEGNGRFLVEFRRRFPGAQITVVDASAAMLRQAQQRLQQAGLSDTGIHWRQEDALQWTPDAASFDLIVTCFFLDCFTAAQLQCLMPAIAIGAARQARWLVADFQMPPAGWRRLRGRVVLALLYVFFGVTTGIQARALVDPAPLLKMQGFERALHQEHDHALLYSSLWVR